MVHVVWTGPSADKFQLLWGGMVLEALPLVNMFSFLALPSIALVLYFE